MSLSSAAYTLWVFWLIVYGVNRVIQHGTSAETVLPLHQRRRTSNWHITIRFLRARVETSRWNTAHDKLLTRLKRGGGSRSRIWLERFYTLGFVSGVIGMVVVFGLLLWTAWTLVRPFSIHKIGISKVVGKLMRRDFTEPGPESPITPILPGVTVPLNHVPVIIITLFLSQIVHELGHAISGALYAIPIFSAGASVTVCVPAAFVSFSAATLDTVRPSSRSRITAAGPFHNFLFWCFWALAGYAAGDLFFTLLGYENINSLGRVVLNVDDVSPLAGYLTPGTIVTKLNDHALAATRHDPDPWNTFLKSPRNDEMNLGWCVEAKDLGSSPRDCCLSGETNSGSLSCFVANTTPNQIGCLDPISVLTSTNDKRRCASGDGCQGGHVCVRPAEQEALLRLTVREGESIRVVLWSGPRREIWDEVAVGRWHPKYSFLPLSLPLWGSIFWEYLMMVNLSLFLFNLIPMGGLDGLYLLQSILTSLAERGQHEIFDLEAMNRTSSRGPPGRGYAYVEKGIAGGAMLLVGLNVVLAMLALIRT